jgi:hypothetical protein
MVCCSSEMAERDLRSTAVAPGGASDACSTGISSMARAAATLESRGRRRRSPTPSAVRYWLRDEHCLTIEDRLFGSAVSSSAKLA